MKLRGPYWNPPGFNGKVRPGCLKWLSDNLRRRNAFVAVSKNSKGDGTTTGSSFFWKLGGSPLKNIQERGGIDREYQKFWDFHLLCGWFCRIPWVSYIKANMENSRLGMLGSTAMKDPAFFTSPFCAFTMCKIVWKNAMVFFITWWVVLRCLKVVIVLFDQLNLTYKKTIQYGISTCIWLISMEKCR